MSITIRALDLEEAESASVLMWKSFYFSNKDLASAEGFEFFREKTATAVLQYEILYGELKLIGAFIGSELVGVCAFNKRRVSLLFVKYGLWGLGVGKKLLSKVISDTDDDLYIDSSAFAVGFYEKMGFTKIGESAFDNGIKSYPMVLKR